MVESCMVSAETDCGPALCVLVRSLATSRWLIQRVLGENVVHRYNGQCVCSLVKYQTPIVLIGINMMVIL